MEAPGGGRGSVFLLKNARRGVSRRGRGRWAGRVSVANWRIGGGGGAKYFFPGPKCPPSFEKYRDTPPISIAILLQKYALLLAESSIYTTNLYHDTPPICIAILLQKY